MLGLIHPLAPLYVLELAQIAGSALHYHLVQSNQRNDAGQPPLVQKVFGSITQKNKT